MNLFHYFGFSSKRYLHPVLVNGKVPKTYLEMGFRSPAHTGPYYHATDFDVPDPDSDPMKIIVPVSGRILYLQQSHDTYGNTSNYAKYTNYITVQVTGMRPKRGVEFYEMAHIAKGSCPYKPGDFVKQGDLLAYTGKNGWITKTKDVWDTHLHFMVGEFIRDPFGFGLTFRSLKIRYR